MGKMGGVKQCLGLVGRRVGRLEPWRVRAVEPVRILSHEERFQSLSAAHWNPMLLDSRDVLVDLYSDAGSAALSVHQWSAMMTGDESYAGAESFHHFKATVSTLMPNLTTIYPVHQGRAAERLIADAFAGPSGQIIPSNGHYVSTFYNLQAAGIRGVNLPCTEAGHFASDHPFKGNMDVEALHKLLATKGNLIPAVFLVLTNQSVACQPVSMENICDVAEICSEFGVPLLMDGARSSENAMFIKLREPGYAGASIQDIITGFPSVFLALSLSGHFNVNLYTEMFSYSSGMWASAMKGALCSMGGWIAMSPTQEELCQRVQELLVLTEGFPTYGGLAGRDLEAAAVGILEGTEETYLRHRLGVAEELGRGLGELGYPVYLPTGASAVYMDAGRFLPEVPPANFPGLSLANALYLEGGVRAFDAGSFVFPSSDYAGPFRGAELTRLAIPRRSLTTGHMDHVLSTAASLIHSKDRIPGYSIVWQPSAFRFYKAHLMPAPH